MPALAARIPTDRPTRYLRQFRAHAEAMASPRADRLRSHAGKSHSPNDIQLHIDGSDTHCIARFGPWGTCALTAGDGALLIRLDCPDADSLARLRDIVAADLTRFSGGGLAIEWNPEP
ncbi:DUF2218 domain-containing protein [Nocardia sp. CDC153]|uniref:DUF2218 domain-containing protein n=1 Tax=Nocardia sp. CDC153 TaxID=3112167 RepID=UPI002DB703EF|nr:DUF2218 domain-containing protein [Nocardia sp. CDC153]MEC3953655.1 DUF2218 domain-containing protein [Nocardia sp. CDC153]